MPGKSDRPNWGDEPVWQHIVFRPITSAGPRVAALLSGDVDLIENVPIQRGLRADRQSCRSPRVLLSMS
jgi:ABC-type transport system substrate-binding protein